MNRYHWIVFIICSLGWAFDCMGQHLFTGTRTMALAELLKLESTSDQTLNYAALATSLMMLGWATGGIIFGIIGDKFGRAKTMFYTILIYSLLTGLNAFSVTLWDFLLIRFLAGVGIGGQFAIGASLLAESVPEKARPHVSGLMQVISGFANVGSALVIMGFTQLGAMNMLPFQMASWRYIFLFGSLPAILSYFVWKYLKEPETWQASIKEGGRKNVGSVRELFTEPTLRKHVVLGMIMAATGVIGAWGIGLFSMELSGKVFQKIAIESPQYRQAALLVLGNHNMIPEDIKSASPEVQSKFIADTIKVIHPAAEIQTELDKNRDPVKVLQKIAEIAEIQAELNTDTVDSVKMFQEITGILAELNKNVGDPVKVFHKVATTSPQYRQTVLHALGDKVSDAVKNGGPACQINLIKSIKDTDVFLKAATDLQNQAALCVLGSPVQEDTDKDALAKKISVVSMEFKENTKKIVDDTVGWWRGCNLLLFNIGAMGGMYGITLGAIYWGRRVTFTIFKTGCIISTSATFLFLNDATTLLILIPPMGFFLMSMFGGYTVYFPELFPTRLRSTGVSFCYNVGRYIAAFGPLMYSGLTLAFAGFATQADATLPARYAGVAMCSVFLIGITVVWFLPETKGKPLPE